MRGMLRVGATLQCKSVKGAGKKEKKLWFTNQRSTTSERPPGGHNEPRHAVSIVGASDACPSVSELRSRRFLPQDAPRLPMWNCAWPLVQVRLSPFHIVGQPRAARPNLGGPGGLSCPSDCSPWATRRRLGRRVGGVVSQVRETS